MLLTPARRRGREILDDPSIDPALSERSLHDVALANRFFGGRRAILREVRALLDASAQNFGRDDALTLLDIGTGLGDIPAAAQRMAVARRRPMTTIGLELEPLLARAAQRACTSAVAADAMQLPFADASIDIITCSQVLHHFENGDAERLLRECSRVARHAVVIGELRRSWLAVRVGLSSGQPT